MAKEKDDLIEKLLENIDFSKLKPEQITGESGLLKQLTKRLVEKAMNAEMTDHLDLCSFWIFNIYQSVLLFNIRK